VKALKAVPITSLVLLGPIVLAGYQAAQATETIVQLVTQLRENGVPVPNCFAQVPLMGEHAVRWWNANLSEPKAAGESLSSMNVNSIIG
jgi:hypothetical protein